MTDAVIDSILHENSTHGDVLFVMQEITLLGVCHGLYTPTEFEANAVEKCKQSVCNELH